MSSNNLSSTVLINRGWQPSTRRGLTLLEIMVALTIAGVALLATHALAGAIASGSESVMDRSGATDREGNAHRLLRRLVGQIEPGTREAPFGGDERMARFTTWCTVPGGWQERCRVTLALDSAREQLAVVAVISTDDVVPLLSGFEHGAFRYIGDAARGGSWFHVWGEGIALPIAIGIILDDDTLIVPIGERG